MQGGEFLERPKEYTIEAEVGQLEVTTFEIKKGSKKVFSTKRDIFPETGPREAHLAICEQQLGPEHPHTATSLNNLAGLYDAQGKDEQAEPLLKRALAIREQQLGPEHPHTAIARENYISLLRAMGREAEVKQVEGGNTF